MAKPKNTHKFHYLAMVKFLIVLLKCANYRSCLLLKSSYGKWHGMNLMFLWLTCHLGQETPNCQSHSQFPFQVSLNEMEGMIKRKIQLKYHRFIHYFTIYLVLFCLHIHLQWMYLAFPLQKLGKNPETYRNKSHLRTNWSMLFLHNTSWIKWKYRYKPQNLAMKGCNCLDYCWLLYRCCNSYHSSRYCTAWCS